MPFDLDLSKKIDAKFCTGRVIIGVRDAKPYAGADYIGHPYEVKIFNYESKRVPNKPIAYDIGVFDAYDKVLVRNKDNEGWMARLYDIYLVGLGHGCQDGRVYSQCIKYDGNEDLLGTTRSK